MYQKLGIRRGEVHAWDSLGYAEYTRPPQRRGRLLPGALRLFRERGDRFGQAVILTHLGDTRQAADDQQGAQDAWQQAAQAYELFQQS